MNGGSNTGSHEMFPRLLVEKNQQPCERSCLFGVCNLFLVIKFFSASLRRSNANVVHLYICCVHVHTHGIRIHVYVCTWETQSV